MEIPETNFNNLPNLLLTIAQNNWEKYTLVCQHKNILIPKQTEFLNSLPKVFALSEFIVNVACNHPQIIYDLVLSNDLFLSYKPESYKQKFNNYIKNIDEEVELIKQLRYWRKREMVRIAWRDFSGWSTLIESMNDLSNLADVTINKTLKLLHKWQAERLQFSTEKELVVIALGKLGANELNFSSDIDLIFAYGDEKNLNDMEAQHFFALLSQKLIKVLSIITEDGFVFRIDTRLRPFGASGFLTLSSTSLEQYYQQNGRDWERYALTRARIISGDIASLKKITAIINNFVYRQYLDYSVIASLRKMKQLIKRESHGVYNDIKRGEGGIREIEFVIQTIQLIHGGKDLLLQQTRILQLLPALAEKYFFNKEMAMDLIAAYSFFRLLENNLQAFADQQTQSLPQDDISKIRLAFAMDFKDWENLAEEIIFHRKKVQHYFELTVAEPRIIEKMPKILNGNQILEAWLENKLPVEKIISLLMELDFDAAENIYEILNEFHERKTYLILEINTKKKTQALILQLLPLIAKTKNQIATLTRILNILDVVTKDIIYLTFLCENPDTWIEFITLCAASPWLANQISHYPFLLEELLELEKFNSPHSTHRLEDELRQYLLPIPEENIPLQIEYLQRFKLMQIMRVAAADLKGILNLMKVSDHLTFTASAILRYAQQIAWHYLVARYGRPCIDNKPLTSKDFLIIAYGKLGGIELAYSSDLDLVFLHPDLDTLQMTDSYKPISNGEFFLKLAQRIIHILNVSTSAGVLYMVDTRLRPSGTSGLLVTSLKTFTEYQLTQAWTWEHQALVRTRPITGSTSLQNKFETIRKKILMLPRDKMKIANDVALMRKKMRKTADKNEKDFFNVMNSPGGIKDIEFIVQYIVLTGAHKNPLLVEYSDNIRILESIGIADLLTKDDVEDLSSAYRAFRAIVHKANLEDSLPIIPNEGLKEHKQKVIKIWQTLFDF